MKFGKGVGNIRVVSRRVKWCNFSGRELGCSRYFNVTYLLIIMVYDGYVYKN